MLGVYVIPNLQSSVIQIAVRHCGVGSASYRMFLHPLQIAVRHFTHALLVLLFESLLPKDEEEDFVVTADDIRQRRKRVSSDRSQGRFDLTEVNNPEYDLDFLDFIVSYVWILW